MAISDVLSDAVSHIKRYLADQPEVYSDIRPRLDALLKEMDAVRAFLDTPPMDDRDPHGVRTSVRNTIDRAAKMPDEGQ